MKTNSNNDQIFRSSLLQDNLMIEPDKAIEARLNYYFQMRNSSRKVHSNSFEGLLVNLFSSKTLGYIAGSFAAVCLGYFLLVGNINSNSINHQYSDTCYQNTFVVDTNCIVKDTCK